MRHYGIELETFKEQAANPVSRTDAGIPLDAPLVGTVARFVPQKGMAYWLDAAALVEREMPDAHFIIVGDGELRQSLERQVVQLGLSGKVHFWGASDVPWRVMGMCDVVAFSSVYEGLPQTGLEALSAGMPTVATRLKGTAEIIRSGWNGLLAPSRSAPKLAEAILALLQDPATRARMGAVAPESVGEYHTSVMIERFSALYERLYAQRTSLPAPTLDASKTARAPFPSDRRP